MYRLDPLCSSPHRGLDFDLYFSIFCSGTTIHVVFDGQKTAEQPTITRGGGIHQNVYRDFKKICSSPKWESWLMISFTHSRSRLWQRVVRGQQSYDKTISVAGWFRRRLSELGCVRSNAHARTHVKTRGACICAHTHTQPAPETPGDALRQPRTPSPSAVRPLFVARTQQYGLSVGEPRSKRCYGIVVGFSYSPVFSRYRRQRTTLATFA